MDDLLEITLKAQCPDVPSKVKTLFDMYIFIHFIIKEEMLGEHDRIKCLFTNSTMKYSALYISSDAELNWMMDGYDVDDDDFYVDEEYENFAELKNSMLKYLYRQLNETEKSLIDEYNG